MRSLLRRSGLFVLVMFLFSIVMVPMVSAEEVSAVEDLFIDTPTIAKGYTVNAPDEQFFVGLRPEVLAVETRVVIKQFPHEQFSFPEGFEPVSDVYEFDIFNKKAFQDEKPLLLKFLVDKPTYDKKRIFFYNGVIEQWVELPSYSDGSEMVKSIIHLPYARMVVLKESVMEYGEASWYAYKGCDCAASPDYPKGTMLKVTNVDNNKSVVVRVNDFGPERDIYPDRVIDLDSVAFKKIGELWQGILPKVKVEPVE